MLRQKLHAVLFVPGERKSDRFFRWLPWIWLVTAYCVTMGVLCLHGRGYIDSDMSSEMLLADLLNREGGLLSTSWWYSTELRVFCLQPFYRIGLMVFPKDWYAAHMVGQGLCMLVLLAAYLYVGHGLGLKSCGAWGAGALACPFGAWYLWYGPFGGFYLPHMIWTLLALGAILHLAYHKSTKLRVLQWLVLLGTSMISGLNGIKGLMGFFLPMLVAAVLAAGLQWHLEPQKMPYRECWVLGGSTVAALAAGIGYILNSTLLAVGHSFSDYNDRSWGTLSLTNLLDKWSEFLSLFGYPSDPFLPGEIPLLSASGILGCVGVLTAGAIVFSLVRLLLRWCELPPRQRIAPLLLFSVCLVQGAVFVFTAGEQIINASYWLTVVPFVFPVLQLEGETEHFRLWFTRRLAAVAFCLCFVATSISSTVQFFTNGYRVNPHLEEVCDWLTDNGYTQGYATFWNGNVLTEWSDGQIEMWVVSDFNSMEVSHWLQKTSHANPPEGPVFLLTTLDELGNMGLSDLYWWSNVVYEDSETEITDRTKRYIVMAYPDYNDMVSAVAGARSWESSQPETPAE